jgi:hypothetical protein
MRDTAFITTKPLQIMVALSIVKQLNLHDRAHFLVVDNFFRARSVFERLTLADWEFSRLDITFCPSYKDAHEFVSRNRIKNLFIDSDVGFRNFIALFRLKLKNIKLIINVYEEGVGTYRSDLYVGIKKILFNLIGIGCQFGGSVLANALYLYDPEEHRRKFPKFRKKICKINLSHADFIRENLNNIRYIFDYNYVCGGASRICYVYLSGWQINDDFIKLFLDLEGDKFIKPHPAIKSNVLDTVKSSVRVIPNHVPAELLILDLERKYEKIIVLHEGSSVERYLSKENLEFVCCGGILKS